MGSILLFSCLLGLLPMAVYTLILWAFDRYEREPAGLLIAAFLWGFVPSAIIALIAQLILGIPAEALFSGNAFATQLVQASVIAPVTEEIIKGLGVVFIYLLFRREFDSVFDGILYGGLVGFGFAAIENVLYLLGAGSIAEVLVLAFLRAFIFGLNHAFFTSLTGIGLALARYQRGPAAKFGLIALGFSAAVFAHSLHNFGATLAASGTLAGLLFSWVIDSLGILFVLGVMVYALYREGQWIAEYLKEEVRLGTLTEEQWQTAQSALKRLGAAWRNLFSGDLGRWRAARRFYQLCAELAFKLYQTSRMGDEGGNQLIIERLRRDLRELGVTVGI